MVGYLTITGLELALLLNFKNARLEWKRVVERVRGILWFRTFMVDRHPCYLHLKWDNRGLQGQHGCKFLKRAEPALSPVYIRGLIFRRNPRDPRFPSPPKKEVKIKLPLPSNPSPLPTNK